MGMSYEPIDPGASFFRRPDRTFDLKSGYEVRLDPQSRQVYLILDLFTKNWLGQTQPARPDLPDPLLPMDEKGLAHLILTLQSMLMQLRSLPPLPKAEDPTPMTFEQLITLFQPPESEQNAA